MGSSIFVSVPIKWLFFYVKKDFFLQLDEKIEETFLAYVYHEVLYVYYPYYYWSLRTIYTPLIMLCLYPLTLCTY